MVKYIESDAHVTLSPTACCFSKNIRGTHGSLVAFVKTMGFNQIPRLGKQEEKVDFLHI